MPTYVLKRLLLMIPTLFGISIIVWFIMTLAPGDPGAGTYDEAQAQRGGAAAGGGEARRIFRETFNLDKPLFWNGYIDLTPERVLAEVRTLVDRGAAGKLRTAADARLSDWGYYAVPALVGALELAGSPGEKTAVLRRLEVNAKRTGVIRPGRKITEEDKELHREILRESRDIDLRLKLEGAATPDQMEARAALWREWYAERKERWEWSGLERLRRQLFDTRFAKYWANLLRFDLGDSHVHREPVLNLILGRLPISMTLAVTSLVIAYLLSVPLGIWSAVRHRTMREQAVSTALFMLYSLPNFFVATLVLRYLGIGQPFQVIPVAGFESRDTFSMTTWQHVKDIAWHVVAPIACMSYVSLAALSRYAKSGLLNVIRSDYVRTARAKGLSEPIVVLKHAVRNGIIPIITLLGTTLPVVVGGSIIIESVFQIPGIGFLTWTSINGRDYNVVIGLTLIVGVLTMVGILLSDILYAVVDPRISYS